MKTVTGMIVSAKPVSLSKAANILSKFVNSDNGASQAVRAYLRRASMDFNELVYFKKHHKYKNNIPKEEASVKSDISHRNHEEYERKVLEKDVVKSEDDKVGKKEKKRKKIDGNLGIERKDKIEVKVEEGNESVKEKSEEKKKKNKRKNTEVESDENGDLVAHKKKKRRKTEDDE
ncbi:uncharacterized protein [Rutidosis leptorrhynchoides]|uniref:uncharacterized protein n=1 Tax=Rutidosis leptorrhynchoides TaxID=125765 RepID=UPI003A9A1108